MRPTIFGLVGVLAFGAVANAQECKQTDTKCKYEQGVRELSHSTEPRINDLPSKAPPSSGVSAPSPFVFVEPPKDETAANIATLAGWIPDLRSRLESATATCSVDAKFLENDLPANNRTEQGFRGTAGRLLDLKICYELCGSLLTVAAQTCDAENGPLYTREQATTSAAANLNAQRPFPGCACSDQILALEARVRDATQWLSAHRADVEQAVRVRAEREQAAHLSEEARRQKIEALMTTARGLRLSLKSPQDRARDEAAFRAQVQPYLNNALHGFWPELDLLYGEAISDAAEQTRVFERVFQGLGSQVTYGGSSLKERVLFARLYADLGRFENGRELLVRWRTQSAQSDEDKSHVDYAIADYEQYVTSMPVRQRVNAAGGLMAATADERAALARDTRAAALAKRKSIDDPVLLSYMALDHEQRLVAARNDRDKIQRLFSFAHLTECDHGPFVECGRQVAPWVETPKTRTLALDIEKLVCADGSSLGCENVGSASAKSNPLLAFGYYVVACEQDPRACFWVVLWHGELLAKVPDFGWWERAKVLSDTYRLDTMESPH